MASGTKDYYGLLGVARDASIDDIKKAFRRKARECHPDVADHDGAEEAFKEVNEAYEVLSDPEKRSMYDRFGTADPRAAASAQYGDFGDIFNATGVEDLFSMFFGGAGATGTARASAREGRDMASQVSVTLLEAAEGATKEVRYARDAPCTACEGAGAAPGGSVVTCPECGGAGQKRAARRTFLGTFESLTPCPQCSGAGTVAEPPCPACAGTGRERRVEAVDVEVPAGIVDGMQIRVPGAGEAGLRGAKAGDLIVGVRVEPHEFLARDGDDLHCKAQVSIAMASLGGDVLVPGLRGDVTVTVPAGMQYGDTARVRGEGMPKLRGNGIGDLIVHLAVAVPKKLDKRQRELLRELAETLGDTTRERRPLERIRDWLGA
jgi:molecular chaperone DnaJ